MKKNILNCETHPLTWRLKKNNHPLRLKEYKKKQGYLGARKALSSDPQQIIDLVKSSGLKGRGGAGFSTGVKWDLMPKKKDTPHYLLCNADEMEPGTYKDKFLMERIPHLLIEGMLIAAFAVAANHAYIFLRGEYISSANYLKHAISEAKESGLLGKNIFNSGFDLEIFLHTGAGRYICGEETALINSLEGRRPNPRSKPPFPSTSGLWGNPTCVNNVETLCNIPAIIENGSNWYRNLSNSPDTGTKLMGFSGRVKNPGLWELPFGTTAREILEDYAGGMKKDLTLKAWQPGGGGTDFLTQNHLDLPMEFKTISNAGSRLGTGLAMAVDNQTSMVSVVLNLEMFFSRESCGWCTPCREGLPWSVKILTALEKKEGLPGDIETLEKLCSFMGPGKTFCAHAPGAVEPLKSAIKHFRTEFEDGVQKTNDWSNTPNLLKEHW